VLLMLPVVLLGSISQELSGADSLNVGTPFSFTITADFAIKNVPVPDSLESFAIIESKQSKANTWTWALRIVPLKTGALTFPRLQVIPASNAASAESTDAFRIHVLSVLAEGDTLLKDIKPLQKYYLQPPFWVYILLVLGILGLAIYLLKNRKPKPLKTKESVAAIPPTIIPAWQKALTALEELENQDIDIATYHYFMSMILREFLEETYSFPALEMTTREIQSAFRKRQLDTSSEIKSFLIYCDMVKFAKVTPETCEIQSRTQWLKGYFTAFAKTDPGVIDA